jgi:hypothetical protein
MIKIKKKHLLLAICTLAFSFNSIVHAEDKILNKIQIKSKSLITKIQPSCITEKDLKSKKITYRGKMYSLPNIPGSSFIECDSGYDCRFGNICKEPNKYLIEYLVTEICTYPNGLVKKRNWKESENIDNCEM